MSNGREIERFYFLREIFHFAFSPLRFVAIASNERNEVDFDLGRSFSLLYNNSVAQYVYIYVCVCVYYFIGDFIRCIYNFEKYIITILR